MNLIVWFDHHRVSDDGDCTIANRHRETYWIQISLHRGASASTAELSNVLTKLRAVTSLKQVYLAASGAGAAVALKLLLMRPDEFQGIALFDPDYSELPPIEFTKRLGQRRAMLVTSVNLTSNVHEALALGRCLHSAGMRITTHFYLPRWFTQERMLQDLAKWVSHQDRLNQEH